MPTYRNDGKNVLLVERTDGVLVPVGPGESVETFKTITVEGFTVTDASPASVEMMNSAGKIRAVANLVGVSWGEHEILLPEGLTRHCIQADFFLDGVRIGWDAIGVSVKMPGSDTYHYMGSFGPVESLQYLDGIFTGLKFNPGEEPEGSSGDYTYTVRYTGWN